jgi:hypothetical protein
MDVEGSHLSIEVEAHLLASMGASPPEGEDVGTETDAFF